MRAFRRRIPAGSLWGHRDFRRFWSAQGVSELGDRVTELAVPLMAVTLLDATPTQVGLLTAAVWLPNLASLFIGAWVDQRRHKRRLMIGADLFRAAVLLTVPVATWLGALSMAQLYGVAILTGTAHVVFSMAYQTFFVRLVARDRYLEANGKLSTTRSASFIAGPAAGGALVQALTAPVAVALDAMSFLFSAVRLARVRTVEAEPAAGGGSLLRRAREGARFVVRHPYLRSSVACSTTLNLFNYVGAALLVLFASRTLGLSAGLIGVAFGVGATGALAGAVCTGWLTRRLGVGRVIAAGAVAFPGAVAIAAVAGGPTWVRMGALAAAEFVGGFAVMCYDVPHNSLRATVTPDRVRSRVAGAYSTINYGVRPLGGVAGGLLGDWIGVRTTLLVSAAGGVLALLWLLRSPIIRVRGLDAVASPDPDPAPAGAAAPVAS